VASSLPVSLTRSKDCTSSVDRSEVRSATVVCRILALAVGGRVSDQNDKNLSQLQDLPDQPLVASGPEKQTLSTQTHHLRDKRVQILTGLAAAVVLAAVLVTSSSVSRQIQPANASRYKLDCSNKIANVKAIHARHTSPAKAREPEEVNSARRVEITGKAIREITDQRAQLHRMVLAACSPEST